MAALNSWFVQEQSIIRQGGNEKQFEAINLLQGNHSTVQLVTGASLVMLRSHSSYPGEDTWKISQQPHLLWETSLYTEKQNLTFANIQAR